MAMLILIVARNHRRDFGPVYDRLELPRVFAVLHLHDAGRCCWEIVPACEAVCGVGSDGDARFGTTVIIVLLIFVISIIAGVIGAALHAIPFIGPIVGQVLQMIVVAFSTLVIVGEYLKLKGPATTLAGTSGGSTTYTPPPPPPPPSAPGPTV